jgi:hypothetical protein
MHGAASGANTEIPDRKGAVRNDAFRRDCLEGGGYEKRRYEKRIPPLRCGMTKWGGLWPPYLKRKWLNAKTQRVGWVFV